MKRRRSHIDWPRVVRERAERRIASDRVAIDSLRLAERRRLRALILAP